MTDGADLLAALQPVVEALEGLGVPYHVGGSVAASVHGVARSTLDADVVAALEEHHVGPFVAALAQDFYVEEEAIRRALRTRSSFNLIHHATMFKVDVFLPGGGPHDAEAQRRAAPCALGGRSVRVASAEDLVLAKLRWFEKTGRTSERQWNDVLGVLRVQGDAIDEAYLRRWAREVGVADLVERALQER